jgi:hypothetical protein
MNDAEDRQWFKAVVVRYLHYRDVVERRGLSQLLNSTTVGDEDCLDQSKIDNRDIMEYGLRMAAAQTDIDVIRDILTRIANFAPNLVQKRQNLIEMEAALSLAEGDDLVVAALRLNSHTSFSIPETMELFGIKEHCYI